MQRRYFLVSNEQHISFFIFLFVVSAELCIPIIIRLESILDRMEHGKADMNEIPMLEEISRGIEGHTICALGDAAAWPVQGLIKRFKYVLEDRLTNPSDYNPEKYFQKSWSGDTFANKDWSLKYGDNKSYFQKS